jgi:hypothetical protein
MNEIEILSQVGFPIALSFYLLFRFEKKLEENTLALQSLKDVIRVRK